MSNDDIYAVVRLVPVGRVTTYGAIAEALSGQKGGARIVGWAMNQVNRSGVTDVPAHRVVNRNGLLTGKLHFEEPTTMQRRLESEGLIIVDDQIQNFETVFWHPAHELLQL